MERSKSSSDNRETQRLHARLALLLAQLSQMDGDQGAARDLFRMAVRWDPGLGSIGELPPYRLRQPSLIPSTSAVIYVYFATHSGLDDVRALKDFASDYYQVSGKIVFRVS